MDQVAELFGTLAFGWVITHYGNLVVLPVLTGIAFLALPFELWAIQRVRSCLPDSPHISSFFHSFTHQKRV